MSSSSATQAQPMIVSRHAMLTRWFASAHLIAVLVQLALGVTFVAGWAGPILHHASNGRLVAALGVVQATLIVALRSARVTLLTRILAVGVVCGEIAQALFGLSSGLSVHVTIGMLVWACSLAIFIRVWAPDWKFAPARE